MINLIETTLINNDPLTLTIVFFFAIAAVISTKVALARTLLKKRKV